MKLKRDDWMVADGELANKANIWWKVGLLGLGIEAAACSALIYEAKAGAPWSGFLIAIVCFRVVMGAIGSWSWFSAVTPPDFWGYRARWMMHFLPAAILSSKRQDWMRAFLLRLADGDRDRAIELAKEQHAYYSKGASTMNLGHARREMSSWAAAARECQYHWERQSEAERMKSPEARSKALEDMGMGKALISQSVLSLEKLEIGYSASEPQSQSIGSKRL